MRLFVGIALPPEASAVVSVQIGKLRSLATSAGIKLAWIPEPKLHITIKFIGEFPENRLPELEQALTKIRVPEPVAIHIRHIDWIADALIMKVDRSQPLLELASATDAALEPLGIKPEKRAYLPHVTLARIRNPDNRAARRAFPSQFEAYFPATSFHLYLSASGQYTRLKEFPLQTE